MGWRDVMLYTGIFVAVIVIPFSMFIRRSPESMGIDLAEAGEAVDQSAGNSSAQASGQDFTVREALKSPTYWFILLASSLRISVTSGILVHVIPIMVWKGTTPQTGADMTALLFFVSIPARLLIGFSGLRLPGQGVLAVGMAVGTVSLLVLDLVPGTWIILPFVAGLAVLEGAAVLNWVLVGNLFGRRNFATLTGIISVFYSAGMMLSPLFLGWMVDRTGGYTESLLVLTGLYAASAVLFAMARRPRQRAGLAEASSGRAE
jgi:sugar phosphate permease